MAAFRRESMCWSEDSFSPSNLAANGVVSVPTSRRASKSVSSSAAPASEAESMSFGGGSTRLFVLFFPFL
uniref:Uncharacterized protein n=1 Tax=Arundo donax TaxID=35708 RepID=A0A0A8ZIV3_ARUDO